MILPLDKYDFRFVIEKEGFHTFGEEVSFGLLRLGDKTAIRNFTLLTVAEAGRPLLEIQPDHREALEVERDACLSLADDACANRVQARLDALP